jgi:hypothetical protein
MSSFGSRFAAAAKTGLSRGFNIIKNTPKYIRQGLELLDKIEKGIDQTKKIAGTFEKGYEETKKQFPKAKNEKIDEGFKTLNDKLNEAKKIDDSLRAIGRTVLM